MSLVSCTVMFLGGELYFRSHQDECVTAHELTENIRYECHTQSAFFRITTRGGKKYLVHDVHTVNLDCMCMRVKGADNDPLMFPVAKDPSKKRIVVLGESSAVLLGWGIDRVIRRSPESRDYEVMNCALGASNLTMLERMFDEVNRYSPDLIIVYFGNNCHYNLWRLPRRYYPLYWVGLVAQKSALLSIPFNRIPYRYHAETFSSPQRLAGYENFLTRLGEYTRQNKVSALICTVPVNMLFWGGDRPYDEELVFEPQWLYVVGRKQEAIGLLQKGLASARHPWPHYLMGEWMRRGSRCAEAYRHYRRALDLRMDGSGENLISPTIINEMIRRKCREEGLMLADLAMAIPRVSECGIPGWDVFSDYCHARDSFADYEAALVLDVLKREEGAQGGAWDIPVSDRLPSANAFFSRLQVPGDIDWNRVPVLFRSVVHDEIKGEGELIRSIHDWIESNRKGKPARDVAVEYLVLGELCRYLDRDEEAVGYLKTAGREDPGWEEPDFQAGVCHLKRDHREEARSAFERAHSLNPRRRDIAYFLDRLTGERRE
ncbi:MAG TPA: tetratricopeptide repeat protein [Elusimicrobiota bacterium]|nr:tetratricopeptide repeat protein [Elusimicrobiota bacterium]